MFWSHIRNVWSAGNYFIIMWKRQNIFDPRPDWYRYSKFMEGRSRFIFRRLAVHHDHHDHWCDLYVIKSKTAKQEEGQLWTDSIYLLQIIQNWDFQGKHRKRRKKEEYWTIYIQKLRLIYTNISAVQLFVPCDINIPKIRVNIYQCTDVYTTVET